MDGNCEDYGNKKYQCSSVEYKGDSMKYITKDIGKEYDGILYFIQRLEEMLFHYSDDIVKAPVHNTSTLIREYIELDQDDNIQDFHKDLVADEIVDSIQNDELIKGNLGHSFVARVIKAIKNNQQETIYYLAGIIRLDKYYSWCIKDLIDNSKDSRKKNEINSLLRKWISSVLDAGYSSEFIYRYLHTCFDGELDNPEERMQQFLRYFTLGKKKYTAYFLFMGSVNNYKRLLSERLNISFENDEFFGRIMKKDNKSFIGKISVEGIDPYIAAEEAYNRIDIFVRFYKVLSNRKKDIVGKTAFIISEDHTEEMYITVKPSGYNNIEVEPKIDMVEAIDNAVLGCQSKPGDTYESIQRIISLHNMALIQNEVNDGFVNFWSIMEVVSKDARGKSKIEKVINSVLPILQNDFWYKYFGSIDSDLKHAISGKDYHDLLDAINKQGNITFKIACLCLLNDYESLREDLFEKLKSHPNIRQRIYKIYLLREDKSKLYDMSEKYAERLKWHIYRLYRVRNGIVHAGEEHKYVKNLGEHLHIYCDSIISEIIFKLSTCEGFWSIQDVLVDTRLLVEMKKDTFNANEAVKEEDIRVLFERLFQKEIETE